MGWDDHTVLGRWDASDTGSITESAGELSAIADLGPGGNDLTLAHGTVLTGTRAIAGLNVLDFDAARLDNTSFPTATEWTMFMVVVADAAANYETIFSTNASDFGVFFHGDENIRIYDGSSEVVMAPFDVGETCVIEMTHASDDSFTFTINGVQTYAGTHDVQIGSTITFGAWWYSPDPLDGAIGEIAILDGVLDAGDRADLRNGLIAKWSGAALAAWGRADESDVALSWTTHAYREWGRADETDSALAWDQTRAKAWGRADEADVAFSWTVHRVHFRAWGRAEEVDTAVPWVRLRARAWGRAAESDTALPWTVHRTHYRAWGRADETDTAIGWVTGAVGIWGRADETDTASSWTVHRVHYRAWGRANETDTAKPWTGLSARGWGRADEDDVAFAWGVHLVAPRPSFTPPAARRWSGDELLDLPAGLGQRIESVEFAILNYDLSFAFMATQIDRTDRVPSIHFDANAETNRTLSGLWFGPDDASRITPLRHLVAPRWVLDDDSRYNLGVFHFATSPVELYSWGAPFMPECYDRSLILNQPRAGSFSVGVGTLLTTAARQLIDELGLTAYCAIDGSSVFATTPQVRPSGTTYRALLAWLCEAMGFYPPFFTNDGLLRLKAVPNPISDAPPDVVYTADESSRIVAGSISADSNIATAPNLYRVIGSPNAGAEVVGEYRVPASAPHSIENRSGFVIVKEVHNQAVADKPAADAAAQAAYANDFDTHINVAFESSPDPRSDGMQIVNFLGTNYREQSWDLELRAGGRMVHNVQEVWRAA